MFGRSTSSFDRLLEKATSQLLLEPDWSSNLMICDSIRQGDTNPKYAVTAIKKKFYHQNPHAALFALQVMETCVKNCGDLVHQEIGTKAFMEEMRDLVKQTTDDNIKTKVLEMVQTWGIVFRNHPKYRIISDTHNLMKAEGWKFPPVREADAMFEADIAPDWAEGDVCRRCRVQFSTFTRQHHCRACGQVFCAKCSAKSCLLPKFGIEREVRVCDSCFDQFGPKDETESPQHQAKQLQPGPLNPGAIMRESNLPEEYLSSPLSKQSQAPAKASGQGGADQPAGGKDKVAGGKTEAELKEEEELQLVLALSMSEAEEKEKLKKKQTNDMLANLENNKSKVTNGGGAKTPPEETVADPELAKYLNRDYWQSKQEESKDTAGGGMPAGIALAKQNIAANTAKVQEAIQGSGHSVKDTASEAELEEFTTSLRTQLEIFVNRMKSNSSRGRPIANDSSVQSLFVNMMTMHSKLVNHIQVQEDSRLHYEGLQDKLTQVRDARAALDALREEERERRRREAEEAERQRQIQMAYKLDQMRKKKAEYLEYQRQMALKRMADQEREMAMIKDASRKNYMTQQQTMYNMYLPYGQQHGMQPGMYPQQGFPPGMQQQVGMMPGMQGMPQQMPGMIQAPGGPGMQQQPGPGMMGPPPPGHEGVGQQDQTGGGPYHYYGHQQQQQPGQPGVQDSFNMQGMAGALPAPVTSATEGNNNGNGQAYTSQTPASGQSDSGVATSGGGGPMMSQQQAMIQQHQTMSPGSIMVPGQQQPGMPGQQPGMPSQQPGMPGQHQGMPGQQPGMPGQQPGMPGQQPGMPGQQQGIPGQQPGMSSQQPGIPGQQPGMPGQQPGMMNPGLQHQQPGLHQQQGMPQQPGMAPGMQQAPGQPAEQNMGAPPPSSQDENSLIVW